jgi:pimeloyl-ACP methyl ester carboxylesterase
MPVQYILQIVFGALSLAILGTSGYLLWSWWDGETYRLADETLAVARDDWRLWTGLALLAFSFLGKFLIVPLVAKPDKRRTDALRGDGVRAEGAAGQALYVETTGKRDGPPVILTHGWGMDSTIWRYAKEDLGGRFKVTSWDLPGLGHSKPAKAGQISLSAFAADLKRLVAEQGRPTVLVGHSIGGMTIQTLARDHPEVFGRDVAGVVLLNTTHTNPLKTMILSGVVQALRWPVLEPLLRLTIWLQPLVWLQGWQSYLSGMAHLANRFGFGRYVTRSQLEHTTLLATRNPPAAQARGILAMLRWDATAALAQLSVPTLVVGGNKDIVTKLEANRTISERVPHGRLQVVDGVNHMGMLERYDIYDAAIADFVESVQPKRQADAPSFAPAAV